jgi:hypothetical protein
MANNTQQKFGGRTKGTPNRTTTEIREKFKSLINNSLDDLENDLKDLDPKDRIKAILDLAKFVLPTLKATELTDNRNDERFTPIVINLGTGINPEENNGTNSN